MRRIERPHRRAPRPWQLVLWASTVLLIALPVSLKLLGFPVSRWVLAFAFVPVTASEIWHAVKARLRARRAARRRGAPSGAAAWPLGEPYEIGVDVHCDGERELCTATADARGIAFDNVNGGLGGSDVPMRVDVTGETYVEAHPLYVEIGGARDRIRLHPYAYVDRERLLAELAARWPDAFRFAEPRRPVAPPARLERPPGMVLTEHFGLASALAGPMDPGNPPPPRKSGLGVGLFVPPPGLSAE
jgi:hypothetical protein